MERLISRKTRIAGTLLILSATLGLWLGREQPKPTRQGTTKKAHPEHPSTEVREESRNSPNLFEATTTSSIEPEKAHSIPNERILSFQSLADYQTFLTANNGSLRIISRNDVLRSIRIQIQDSMDPTLLPENAQTDFNYTLLTPLPISADSQAPDKSFNGTALEFMGVPQSNNQAGKGIKVAVLDTGIRNHSTFDSKNLQQLGSTNKTDLLSHGTAVASLIAGKDGIGIAPQAEILGIQVLDTDGIGDTFTLAEGIVQAVDSGAKIINMSLGSYGTNLALENAVAYANSKKVVLVASAGNESITTLPYPATYDSVIAVAAIDADGHPTSFSNQSYDIDLAAPGVGVHAAWEEDKWISFSGTSAAAPYVSGAIAAISSEMNISATEAAKILLANANDSGLPGTDPQLGLGYIDLNRSLNSSTNYVDLALSDIYLDPNRDENDQNTVHITAQNRGTQTIPAASLSFTLPNGITQDVYLGSLTAGQSAHHTLAFDENELSNGYRISAHVESNNDSISHNDRKETSITIPIETSQP